MSRIALIDADSIIYMVGWNFRPKEDDDPLLDSFEMKKPRVIAQTDNEIQSILMATNADRYLGAVGHPTIPCFRHDVAKFAVYKGNRKAENEVFKLWKPVIKERMMEHWGFIAIGGLEADDIIALAAHYLNNNDVDGPELVICSPDKDLRTVPGMFYDYKKLDFADIDHRQSRWLFWYQMIVGDSSDNVKGIPGKGDKAAHKALDPLVEFDDYDHRMEMAVRGMYFDHFGSKYGALILMENEAVLSMMTPQHPFYEAGYLEQTKAGFRDVVQAANVD